MIVGKPKVGASEFEFASDTKNVTPVTFVNGLLPKLSAYIQPLDGGAAAVKAVIYDDGGALVAVSKEVLLAAGSDSAWYDFVFVGSEFPAGVPVQEGTYRVGLIVGGGRVGYYTDLGTGADIGWSNANTYSDGPSDPFGTPDPGVGPDDMTIYGDIFEPYAPPPGCTEVYYARLPIHEGQRVFGSTKPIVLTTTLATATQHGTGLDPERGSFVVVANGGPLADLIGERVKITRERGDQQSVFAFVHNVLDISDVAGREVDLSLPRRLWMKLALAGDDTLRVIVEKMS